MNESFVNPTYYNLQRVVIKSDYSNLTELDVTALIPSLSITSSIVSETMYGTARFIDSVGLLEETPLRGEEQIIFEIADSRTINENGGIDSGRSAETFRYVGFIYKIDNVNSKEINDAITYDIHFISYQSFVAGTYSITRAFRDEKVSNIVQTLFSDYFDSPNDTFLERDQRKELIIEETDGSIRCTIPRMRAEEAMHFLSRRAYSASDSPSCTFRFFESTKGYHFVTDEELFRLSETDERRRFNFTYLDAIPNTLDFFEEQLNNLELLDNTKRVNSIDDLYNGVYRNKVIELDILSKQLNLIDETGQYDYLSRRRSYFDARRFEQLKDRHTTSFIESVHRTENTTDEDIQKRFIVIRNFIRDENSSDDYSMPAETYYSEIISNRQAYSKHIESITVESIGPGRFDISAGDIINLSVKKFQFADDNQSGSFEQNKHLSGLYIVHTVSHKMEHDTMKNHYKLVKKDWSEVVDLRFDDGIGPR